MALLRYTPPTCTLEITAKRSPLSRWASRPVLKDLQFELYFDAPQLPEEQQVKVWGNQEQLDALTEAVTTYVQEFLQHSSAGLAMEPVSWGSQVYRDSPADLDEPKVASPDFFPSVPMARAAAPTDASLLRQPAPVLESAMLSVPASEPVNAPSHGIYLQPQGLLAHDLFLGTLATPDSGPVIHLGALQLFDLATALDEYRAEVLGLPTLPYAKEKGAVAFFKKPAAWGNIAALLLITVGVATALTRYYQQQPSTTLETANAPVAPSPQQPVAVVPPPPSQTTTVPLTPAPTVTVPPTPGQSLPSLPSGAGAAKETLPSLPSGAVPAQPNPAQPQPQQQTTPNNLQIPGQSSSPAIGNNAQQSIGLPPAGSGTSRSADSSIPPIRFPDLKTPAPPDISDIQVPPPAPTMNPSVPPSTPATPPAVVTVPRGNEPPPLLPDVQLPDNFNTASGDLSAGSQESLAQDSVVAKGSPSTRSAIEPAQAPTQEPGVSAASQINQAQDYFQQRWKPRPEVTQPLEYTLSLNPDGSIKQITPRGLNAQRLIDVTGMPLMNEPFVSPIEQGQAPARIRVVLRPDGGVQTFEEPYKEGL